MASIFLTTLCNPLQYLYPRQAFWKRRIVLTAVGQWSWWPFSGRTPSIYANIVSTLIFWKLTLHVNARRLDQLHWLGRYVELKICAQWQYRATSPVVETAGLLFKLWVSLYLQTLAGLTLKQHYRCLAGHAKGGFSFSLNGYIVLLERRCGITTRSLYAKINQPHLLRHLTVYKFHCSLWFHSDILPSLSCFNFIQTMGFVFCHTIIHSSFKDGLCATDTTFTSRYTLMQLILTLITLLWLLIKQWRTTTILIITGLS